MNYGYKKLRHKLRKAFEGPSYIYGERLTALFNVEVAATPDRKRDAYEVRHRIFCIEKGFEPPQVNGMETDEYDDRAVHSILSFSPDPRDTEKKIDIGTIRLILSGKQPYPHAFPIQKTGGNATFLDEARFAPAHTAEISRMSISKTLTRDAIQSAKKAFKTAEEQKAVQLAFANLPLLFLIQGAYNMATTHHATNVFTFMEPAFLKRMRSIGLHFKRVGEAVEHHGLRQPCIINVYDSLKSQEKTHPAQSEICTDHGRILKLATHNKNLYGSNM